MKVEPVVPCIICEAEGEEDMALNLRVGFKKKQRKRLYESIAIAPLPAKKSCTEILHPMPVSTIPLAPKPSADAVGPSRVLTVRPLFGKDADPERGRPSTGPIPLIDDSVECMTSVPLRPQVPRAPSWEEMAELLK